MSRVAQHRKLFWGFLFWLNGRHYMWCRNFEKSLQTEPRRSLKTLYPDQLVVWEWSVVLTTKDLQIIKEADDGPLLRKLAISHYIHNSIVIKQDMDVQIHWKFDLSKRCLRQSSKSWLRKILIFRSGALVFTDNSSKSYIFWYAVE